MTIPIPIPNPQESLVNGNMILRPGVTVLETRSPKDRYDDPHERNVDSPVIKSRSGLAEVQVPGRLSRGEYKVESNVPLELTFRLHSLSASTYLLHLVLFKALSGTRTASNMKVAEAGQHPLLSATDLLQLNGRSWKESNSPTSPAALAAYFGKSWGKHVAW